MPFASRATAECFPTFPTTIVGRVRRSNPGLSTAASRLECMVRRATASFTQQQHFTMDNVLAKPADLCCLKGDFHTGEPTGTIEQIEGVDTYVARPRPERSNGNVILFFPDAFGLHMNSFLMMDAFAECGYLTLGVDFFLGV